MFLTKLSVQEISKHASQHCLMSNYNNIVLIFQRRQSWSETRHNVNVRLSPRVAVPKLVLVAPSKLLRETLLHLLVGQTFTYTLEKTKKDCKQQKLRLKITMNEIYC